MRVCRSWPFAGGTTRGSLTVRMERSPGRREQQEHRIGIGEDSFREIPEKMDEPVQGDLPPHAPRNLEEHLQLVLCPLQFLRAEGQRLLPSSFFSDVALP